MLLHTFFKKIVPFVIMLTLLVGDPLALFAVYEDSVEPPHQVFLPIVNQQEGGEVNAARTQTRSRNYIVVLNENMVLARIPQRVKGDVDTARATIINQLAQGLVQNANGKLKHVYTHSIYGFSATLPINAIRNLQAQSVVDFIVLDSYMWPSTIQTPVPSWGLDRVDQQNLPLNNSYFYGADGTDVHAYIIDSGIRTSHNDFGGRVSGGTAIVGSNTEDCTGHGTHVAGIVGGSAYGIAKNVNLHPVRVFDCSGGASSSTIIAAVDWVTENHMDPAVVNMSLGGEDNLAVDTAVQRSIDAGITYVIAAGNDNTPYNNNDNDACLYSPARVGPALTVGSSTISDQRLPSSYTGSCLDLFAPGGNIISAWHTSDSAQDSKSGTSMAAPHVTGAAALYLEENPNAMPHQVANHLIDVAVPNVLSNVGAGSPNLLLHIPYTPPQPIGVTYRAHVKGDSWLSWVFDGATAGTTGENRRMEALQVNLTNPLPGMQIKYRAYVRGDGWKPWVFDGATAGTTGENRRAEAFQIELVNAPPDMGVEYRAHVRGDGWLPWVSNGATAGTIGENRRAEAIEIRIIP